MILGLQKHICELYFLENWHNESDYHRNCLVYFNQSLDAPLLRQFQVFQADLWVPADPETQQLLSLQGIHAHPGQGQRDGQSVTRLTTSLSFSSEIKRMVSTYSGSSSTSNSSLSRNTLEDKEGLREKIWGISVWQVKSCVFVKEELQVDLDVERGYS